MFLLELVKPAICYIFCRFFPRLLYWGWGSSMGAPCNYAYKVAVAIKTFAAFRRLQNSHTWEHVSVRLPSPLLSCFLFVEYLVIRITCARRYVMFNYCCQLCPRVIPFN